MRIMILAGLLAWSPVLFSQDAQDSKFGDVFLGSIQKTIYDLDTNASAVVLFDIGSTRIIANNKGSFSLEFTRRTRIHILKKEAYNKATVEIPIYTSGELEEKLSDLKASTFNDEEGKVVETKLDKNAIFKERKNKNLVYQKFTFPSVKEGSVIEMEYKLTSDFLFNLQPWNFQGDIPCLWSEYNVAIPQFLVYVWMSQGDQQYFINERKDSKGEFNIKNPVNNIYEVVYSSRGGYIKCTVAEHRWVYKNIPALKEEVYTSSINNYIKRLEFQLSEYRDPFVPEKIMTTWPDLAQKLLKRDDFGQQLEDTNWLETLVNSITQDCVTDEQKAEKIYNYVRDNLTCTDYSQLYTDHNLKDVLKRKNGSVAEINLLLVAMLRIAGISAEPVILSTKKNGFTYADYPLISKFNYVICKARPDNIDVLLDATHRYMGYGKLDPDCYNGSARIVDQYGTEINLSADQLLEKNSTGIYLTNESTHWTAKVNENNGYYESVKLRKSISKGKEDDFFKEKAKDFSWDAEIHNAKIDSLDDYEKPVAITYELNFSLDTASIIYFNPVITGAFRSNPFKAAVRNYPVEMSYKTSDQYLLTMYIPDGYHLDEIPKSVTYKINEQGDVVFEYRIVQAGEVIMVKTKLDINKTKFEPFEYDQLREFFNRVVAKENEQIVFRKS